MDAIGLLEGEPRFRDIVGRHPNVERIICGHVHRTVFQRYAGTVASICPSVAHQVALDLRPEGLSAFVMEPPGFHLHQWHAGQLVTHVAAIGDYAGPYSFYDESGLIDE